MAEKWRKYETLILFDPELGTEGTEEHVQRAREFITQEGGRILKGERWGLRDTAFEIKNRRKAYYLLLEYAGPARAATELDRRLNLLDTVLKFQTVKLEEEVDPASLADVEEVVSEGTPQVAAEKAPEPKKGRRAEEDEDDDSDESDENDEK